MASIALITDGSSAFTSTAFINRSPGARCWEGEAATCGMSPGRGASLAGVRKKELAWVPAWEEVEAYLGLRREGGVAHTGRGKKQPRLALRKKVLSYQR